ncbi:MAG TPA: exodeoxyribonuclease VII large subunit [Nitrospiraceae bacterium]
MTVAELTSLIRSSIETQFADVWLEGEISNLRTPSSGHVYCTLKDSSSQIRAVLFRSTAVRLRFALQEGLHVIVRGRLTVYEARGEYQMVLDHVQPKGIGALQLAFEQLKKRLAAEGLFDQNRKRPLPLFPQTVGIVTSITGAAIRDLLTVLDRRWPLLHILIVPVQVQGDGAAKQIADAVALLNRMQAVDVMIVGRGGGSWEDLWSFNEEVVVRAIATSRIPVVSAVGHEIDVMLSDFAADVRAATPSAAAEMVVPKLSDIVVQLREYDLRTHRAITRRCSVDRQRLQVCLSGIPSVLIHIQEEVQMVDELTHRLCGAMSTLRHGLDRRVQIWHRDLLARNPLISIKQRLTLIPQLITRLHRQMKALAMDRRKGVLRAMAELNNLSPLAILDRGYCILLDLGSERIIRHIKEIRAGQALIARLASGRVVCSVKDVIHETSP